MMADRFMQIICIIHDNERNSALRKIIPQLVCVAELPDWLELTTNALGIVEPTWNVNHNNWLTFTGDLYCRLAFSHEN
jgi:hypothetical protein